MARSVTTISDHECLSLRVKKWFQDHTTASWIRGEVVQKGLNPGSTMHSATMGQAKGALYRPGMTQQVLKLTVHYSMIRPH